MRGNRLCDDNQTKNSSSIDDGDSNAVYDNINTKIEMRQEMDGSRAAAFIRYVDIITQLQNTNSSNSMLKRMETMGNVFFHFSFIDLLFLLGRLLLLVCVCCMVRQTIFAILTLRQSERIVASNPAIRNTSVDDLTLFPFGALFANSVDVYLMSWLLN